MSKNNRHIGRAKNFGFNTSSVGRSNNLGVYKADPKNVEKNLSNFISPVQLQRLRTDVSMWRDAIAEAERAYYPFRVKMHRIFIDTILNGHVFSLMERRKDLTLLRNFKICDSKGVESEELTQQFKELSWFETFVSYVLDAKFFGYSLISLGDIINDQMQEPTLVPRWFVSPDRWVVGSYIYSNTGKDFREKPESDWHIYVKTPSDSGVSPCGYGLLYQVALYEIFLRNTLGFNGDYVELFAMPYRIGKTTKTTEAERSELESAIRNMGSAGYAIIDPMDEINFLENSTSGTGYKSYESLEARCEKKVSKIILGHADAMDSTPGKIGGGQGEDNPVQQALYDKQTKDGRLVQNIINSELLPRLRNLGIDLNIPEGYHFEYLNDGEDEEFREREDASNLVTANIAQTMSSAGLQMSPEYFTERTGIPSEKKKVVEPNVEDMRNDEKVKNRLKELYK